MLRFHKLFEKGKCAIIGMVHVGALPGTPMYKGDVKNIIKDAVRDATAYKECNIDGILVENMHDVPYLRSRDISPETVAIMTRVCTEIKSVLPESIRCGVQILAGCNREALAVAKAANLEFIRAEGFVFSHIAGEGFTDACAGSLLRYRKQIDAEDILIFSDIKKKHSSHAITSDISLSRTVHAAEFFLTDGVVITGNTTGDPPNTLELAEVKHAAKGPVIVGSGVTADNIESYMSQNAVIIGSHFKVDGIWQNEVDKDRIQNFVNLLKEVQNKMEEPNLIFT